MTLKDIFTGDFLDDLFDFGEWGIQAPAPIPIKEEPWSKDL
jgi:hypothetical protein